MRNRRVWGAAVLAAVTVVGAAGGAGAGGLPQHSYVSDTISLPMTSSEAATYGRNLDGVAGRDNTLGNFFAVLAAQGLDLVSLNASAVSSGELLMLHTLRADSFANTKHATWQVRYSDPVPEPDFSGAGTFAPSPAMPRSWRLPATIKNRRVKSTQGTVPAVLDLGAGPIALVVTRAVLSATCTKSRCTDGRLNGAVTKAQVDTVLVPALAQLFQPIVARDCPQPTTCADGSTGKTLENLFDANDDGTITADELLASSLLQAVLAPDLDLLNAQGAPGHDGVADSLSFGIAFTGVRATIG
jgi:hypothetical protein